VINGQREFYRWMEVIVNMQGEDDFEAEYSIDQLCATSPRRPGNS
jgi:hypothetical protein